MDFYKVFYQDYRGAKCYTVILAENEMAAATRAYHECIAAFITKVIK